MTGNLRRWILIGGAAVLLLLPVFAYAVDSMRSDGEVARGVTAEGVALGGLGEEDALAAVAAYENQLARTPAMFSVKSQEFVLIPSEIELEIDEEAVVTSAMAQRRDTGFFGGFFPWLGSFGDVIEIEIPVTINEELLDEILEEWEQQAIALPAYEGGLIVRGTTVLPDYPRPGEGIDTEYAQRVVQASVTTLDRTRADLRTLQIEPELTNADIDEAAAEAATWIDEPVTLSADDPELAITFTEEQLAAALVAEVQNQSETQIVLSFDPEELEPVLTPLKPEIEHSARNARFDINESTGGVTLLPSRAATLLDVDLVAGALVEAAPSRSNSGEFPFANGGEPSFTTEEAEAMEPITKITQATTSHAAGQDRVVNIHLIADAVDGAVVYPGQEFSINEHVGQRTLEKGYLPAKMISGGELVDDVGGGVSQFATTFYNAVFKGCYEDVEHKPHSYYFSRYPEVNEATISWPAPNLIFRNNTDAVVIIKTQYTATEITVQFYGNNGGCTVERRLGTRYDLTEPGEEYIANPDLTPDDERVTQNGWGGFTNSVTRVMTWPDGRVEEERYVWVYKAAPKIREVHPCKIPGTSTVCPIQVPSLLGGSVDGARATLEGLGLSLAEGPTIGVTDESQNGLIVDQTPESGDWVSAGTTVTVSVGVYVPPEEPPPDEEPPPEEEPPPDEG